jgi:hypothetical protein
MKENNEVSPRFTLVGKAFLPWAIVSVVLIVVLGTGFYVLTLVKPEVDNMWNFINEGLKESGEIDKKAESKHKTGQKTP